MIFILHILRLFCFFRFFFGWFDLLLRWCIREYLTISFRFLDFGSAFLLTFKPLRITFFFLWI